MVAHWHVPGEHIKTCKTFELATQKRVVWVAALHQVCLDNTLFLPSFPIPDMSDLELKQAAIAPHRWIGLCSTSEKRDPGDPGAILWPQTTRVIMPVDLAMQPMPYIFLVPGGQFMVIVGHKGFYVWDLGLCFKCQSHVNCFSWTGRRISLQIELHGSGHPRRHGPYHPCV